LTECQGKNRGGHQKRADEKKFSWDTVWNHLGASFQGGKKPSKRMGGVQGQSVAFREKNAKGDRLKEVSVKGGQGIK